MLTDMAADEHERKIPHYTLELQAKTGIVY
jgi:hypothetical protein